jgi:SagB-type dehydrogenase family enzyme
MNRESKQWLDSGPVDIAAYDNSFRAIDPWDGSTGFRTHMLHHRAGRYLTDCRLAEDFLINSRLSRGDRETESSIQSYFTDPGVLMLSMVGEYGKLGARSLELPAGRRLRLEFAESVLHRRSQRSYTGDAMDCEDFAAILRSAAAVTAEVNATGPGGSRAKLRFRAAASGGGLYPVDLGLVVLNVESIPTGLYRYDPVRDTLWETGGAEDVQSLLNCFSVPEESVSISRANVIFLLLGTPWRAMRKYGSRGLRLLLLEAGAIGQNLHLASVAAGYGSVDCASIYEDEANQILEADGLFETLLHTIIVGVPG